MDIKETEKMLEQSASKMKMRDFSEVWNDIKDEIVVPKRKPWVKRFLPAIISACLVLIVAIALPIYFFNIPAPDIIYYCDNLSLLNVSETEFYQGLFNENINHVDFNGYEIAEYNIYKTEDNLVKGGYVDLYLYDNSVLIEKILIRFYDEKVELSDTDKNKEYSQTYEKDGLTTSYNVDNSYAEYNIYSYDIFATYNKVNYIIEYMGNVSNPVDFFESFFN